MITKDTIDMTFNTNKIINQSTQLSIHCKDEERTICLMQRKLKSHRTSPVRRLTYNKGVGVYVLVDGVSSQSYID